MAAGVKDYPFDANGHVTSHRGDTIKVITYGDNELFITDHVYDCAMCGRILETVISGEKVQITAPCTLPDGITTKILLDVPSGKIIVTDDLRPVYDGFNDREFAPYNTAMGQAQVVQGYASQGCAYGPVGNSCPGLYRTGEGTYVIASPAYDDDVDEILPKGWELIAGIATDLWAYSIADFGDWTARGGDVRELEELGYAKVVDIAPGTYEFTHHAMEKGFDGHAEGTVIFAEIRKL